jgi:hypothetical protein
MFRENHQHLQSNFFDPLHQMSPKIRQRLEKSWAGTFYSVVFCRIDETPYAKLFSNDPSRPNAAINILVSTDILKFGFGWSDEELFDHIMFDLQVRYALGLRDINTIPFELRTLYNFRRRTSQYMQETGENLLEQVFVQVTDEQLAALKLDTRHQRMDSVLIRSNIRQFSRLQLLVEVTQRVWRILAEAEKVHYAYIFEPYMKGTAGQFCYHVKPDDVEKHLVAIGQLMSKLIRELEEGYAEDKTYRMLQRVFAEHFNQVSDESTRRNQISVKTGDELSPQSLQSPDDWEATYREKRGEETIGFAVNLTETCNPKNELQLITQVQVAPNSSDDQQFVADGLPDLKARMDLEAMWTDGGYTGQKAEETFRQENVEHIPTNIRGRKTAPDRLGLETFTWKVDKKGKPLAVKCPGGQQVKVEKGRKKDRFIAYFEQTGCENCAFAKGCPARPMKRRSGRSLNISLRQVQVALLRQRAVQTRGKGNNWRAAVESTVRSVSHPFGGHNGKLPVRGQIRATQAVINSSLMTNVRRIWRYEQQIEKKDQEKASFLSLFIFRLKKCFHMLRMISLSKSNWLMA